MREDSNYVLWQALAPTRWPMLPSTRSARTWMPGGVVEYGGVLAPVKQRLADQVVRDCPEPTLGPCCCLGSPPQVVVAAGQQVARISRAGQRRGMLSVVSCP